MFRNLVHIMYHIMVVVLSAAIALSLPHIVSFIAKKFLIYWSLIESEKIFLISLEIALAVLLIIIFNYIGKSWKNSMLSRMAKKAGLAFVAHPHGLVSRRKLRRLKEKHGFARDIMIIGATGFQTFVEPKGDLYNVIQNCRDAKIILLDPTAEGASLRAKSMIDPEITPESYKEQIIQSINFLKGLRSARKNIKLKLYQDLPLLKLNILGDYIFIKHYHSGLDVKNMPEFVLSITRTLAVFLIHFTSTSFQDGMTLICLNIHWRPMNLFTEIRPEMK